jgi:hypothetical protein
MATKLSVSVPTVVKSQFPTFTGLTDPGSHRFTPELPNDCMLVKLGDFVHATPSLFCGLVALLRTALGADVKSADLKRALRPLYHRLLAEHCASGKIDDAALANAEKMVPGITAEYRRMIGGQSVTESTVKPKRQRKSRKPAPVAVPVAVPVADAPVAVPVADASVAVPVADDTGYDRLTGKLTD